MDRDYTERNHLAARYLAGQLSDEEAQAFERAYLADPSLVDDVELVAKLKGGLRGLKERGELEQALTPGSRWLDPRLAWAASIFATVGLASVLALWNGERESRRELQNQLAQVPRDAQAAAAAITRIVRLEMVRTGESASQVLDLGTAAEQIALLVDVSVLNAKAFDVQLLDGSGSIRWKAEGVEPKAGEVLVVVDSSLLEGADQFALEFRESGVVNAPAALRLGFAVARKSESER